MSRISKLLLQPMLPLLQLLLLQLLLLKLLMPWMVKIFTMEMEIQKDKEWQVLSYFL